MRVGLSDILQAARRAGPWRLRVAGVSMLPRLLPDDVLDVRPESRVRLGDVVVFRSRGILIAHRVIGVAGALLTAGDASRGQTEHVDRADVLGVAQRVIRRGTAPFPARSFGAAIALRARIALKYYARIMR